MIASLPPAEPHDPEVVVARPVQALPFPPALPRPPSPLELPTLTRRDALLDLMLVLLIALLPLGFQVIAVVWIGEADVARPPILLLTIQRWFDVALVGGLMTYLALRHGLALAHFGLRRNRPLHQLLWSQASFLAAYGWLLLSVTTLALLTVLFPALQDDLLERRKIIDLLPVESYGQTVLLLIPVAIHEEVVFRGLLLPYLRRVFGAWWVAILISSGVFAALHFEQGWLGVLQILGVGTLWAIFFVWSRSLPAAIVAHFIFNFLQFQLIRLLPWGTAAA